VATGADQRECIWFPAALCRIVVLKPTHCLVSYTGFGSNDIINGKQMSASHKFLEADHVQRSS
jgi:hypothetical protein